MTYAIRKDGQSWRSINSVADVDPDEVFSETAPDPVQMAAWSMHQQQAQALLDKSDVTMLRCAENSVAVPAAWATYRKALRSIISATSGDPTQPLPTRPTYPAGT